MDLQGHEGSAPLTPTFFKGGLWLYLSQAASSVSLDKYIRFPKGRANPGSLRWSCRCLAGPIPSVQDSSIHATNTPQTPADGK